MEVGRWGLGRRDWEVEVGRIRLEFGHLIRSQLVPGPGSGAEWVLNSCSV